MQLTCRSCCPPRPAGQQLAEAAHGDGALVGGAEVRGPHATLAVKLQARSVFSANISLSP